MLEAICLEQRLSIEEGMTSEETITKGDRKTMRWCFGGSVKQDAEALRLKQLSFSNEIFD